jgi:hypothetical protein
LECLSLWLPSLAGLGARASAKLQMRPMKGLKALVSERTTVRMIDELLRAPNFDGRVLEKGSEMEALSPSPPS